MSGGRAGAQRVLVRIQPWLLRRGEVVWRPLRRVKPVLRIKKAVVLTRHDDVRLVLERDDAFGVTYGEAMEKVAGPFILGMDDGPVYRAEASALAAAAGRDDLPAVAALTRERAHAELAGGAPLDAVALADAVVGENVDRYFGVPEIAGQRHRDAARDVFRAVFLDGETPAVLEAGRAGAKLLVEGIETAMARVRDAGGDDTVLGRLLAAGDLPDDAVPRNLVGLVAAWTASVPRAFALALDALLDHPAEVERAAGAAGRGDEEEVARLLLEAMRLQPQAPFLTRRVRAEVVLAPGAAREHRVRPGDVVIAVTSSAMRDARTVAAPDALDPERPDADLLHFGAGIHRCFGAAISTAQMGALGTVLLAGAPLERRGALAWGGAFPASLPLRKG